MLCLALRLYWSARAATCPRHTPSAPPLPAVRNLLNWEELEQQCNKFSGWKLDGSPFRRVQCRCASEPRLCRPPLTLTRWAGCAWLHRPLGCAVHPTRPPNRPPCALTCATRRSATFTSNPLHNFAAVADVDALVVVHGSGCANWLAMRERSAMLELR